MKRLLIITQSVDRGDPILGFFHAWIERLAPHYAHVEVICLRVGTYALPENVSVHSLGKEKGRQRTLRYIFRFYRLLFRLRGSYDSVFVHMNEEYVLLAGLAWRIQRLPVALWRNFHSGSWRTRLAVALATRVFCTSRASFTARFAKTRIMPVGVELEQFAAQEQGQRLPASILSLGRIAPVKRIHVLIDALLALAHQGVSFTAAIYGDPLSADKEYYDALQRKVGDAGMEANITFHPGVPHRETPSIFEKYEMFVNLSPSGMYDKTIFEAAAAGTLPIASSSDYVVEAPPVLGLVSVDADSVATQLKQVMGLTAQEKQILAEEVRSLAEAQDLSRLVERLVQEL